MKTLDKLKEICDTHNVVIEAYNSYIYPFDRIGNWWHITFYAPKGKGFISSGLSCVGYGDKSIVSSVKYIREEIEQGFFSLSSDDEFYDGVGIPLHHEFNIMK
tara:strand:- start:93 stop:401 length:309 start_codon:yes stop_codon:yes gene_type:complete